jgi:hypothetical protein
VGDLAQFADNLLDGVVILDDIQDFVGSFVAYPSEHAHIAHVLWIAHTHLMDCWDSTPRLAALSPEPACGKSRVLEVSEVLVPRPVEAVNVTPAYLFRKVDDPKGRPTILHDEIDTVFGPKARENEEIRGLLNAGHRKGAVAGRCAVRGNAVIPEEIPAYCAVAMAGIGEDRPADVWEALLAVADTAGGEWPDRARAACLELVAESQSTSASLGVRLLQDLKEIFGNEAHTPTYVIVSKLIDIEEAPWGSLRGKEIDPRTLARLLKPYGITPRDVRIGPKVVKGYYREDLWDAWQRYLTRDEV